MAKRRGNPGLRGKLVDKSIDAYIMALETINRISIAYRVEAFAYLLCNAWEMLLKARIIDQERSRKAIYYEGKKSEVARTLSLRDCLIKIFPKDTDAVRRNVARVADLRDAATHLVISEVPKDILALLQACVLNFHRSLNAWFGISLIERVPIGMMTIVYDLSPDQFANGVGALSNNMNKDTLMYLANLRKEVAREREELGNVAEFSVVFDFKLALTKKAENGDIVLTQGSLGETIGLVEKPRDPGRTHPHRQKELIKRVNELLDNDVKVNTHDIKCITAVHRIEKRSDFRYQGMVTGSPIQYSDSFADWIVERYRNSPSFFEDTRARYKPPTKK